MCVTTATLIRSENILTFEGGMSHYLLAKTFFHLLNAKNGPVLLFKPYLGKPPHPAQILWLVLLDENCLIESQQPNGSWFDTFAL